jgi:O-antigen/teichoic acid export membrane protein
MFDILALRLLAANQIIEKFLNLAIIPILAVYLGPSGFGFWMQVMILIPLFNLALLLNCDVYFVTNHSKKSFYDFFESNNFGSVVVSFFKFLIAASCLTIIIAQIFPNFFSILFFGGLNSPDMLGVVLFLISEVFYYFFYSIIRASDKEVLLAKIISVKTMLKTFALICLVWFELSLQQLFGSFVIMNIIICTGTYLCIKTSFQAESLRPFRYIKPSSFLLHIQKALMLGGVALLSYVAAHIERFVIAGFKDFDFLGILSISLSAGYLAAIGFLVLSPIIYPKIVIETKSADPNFVTINNMFFSFYFGLGVPALYFLYSYSEFLFMALGMEDYIILPSAILMIALSGLLLSFWNYLAFFTLASGEKRVTSISLCVIITSKLFLVYWLYEFSYLLVGIALSSSVLLGIVVLLFLSKVSFQLHKSLFLLFNAILCVTVTRLALIIVQHFWVTHVDASLLVLMLFEVCVCSLVLIAVFPMIRGMMSSSKNLN